MKKLFVALVLMISSSAFASSHDIQLNEADSKELYYALAKWGTRVWDKDEKSFIIFIARPFCIQEFKDQSPLRCTLYDRLHEIERTRSDKAAWLLAKLLARHLDIDCLDNKTENGENCVIAAREITCLHPLDDKNGPPILRRYLCDIDKNTTPSN